MGFSVLETWILSLALLLAVIAAVQGGICVHRGRRSPWTVVWLSGSFFCQFAELWIRGQMRGTCPLGDTGEIFIFAAWSLTMFYLVVGSVFRLSLLGVFTAPLVSFFLVLSLIPGMRDAHPEHIHGSDMWRAFHAGFSVLAYGALGLSAVAAVMFLVLNRQLKDALLTTGLFKKLPPARELILVVRRLLSWGLGLLSLGVICGMIMEEQGDVREEAVNPHLLIAFGVWLAYGVLLLVHWKRGLPPRILSIASIGLFLLSLFVFLVI